MSGNLPAFLLFAVVAGFTPGPNNLMLATSGVNFGLRRTMPHVLGVITGYPLLFAAAGSGLGSLFERLPWLHTTLMISGSAYLLWLAWKIAFAPAAASKINGARPLSYWQAAAFQWVNPKIWMVVITSVSVYAEAGDGYFSQVAIMTVIALLVALGSSTTWAALGVGIRQLFEHRPNLLRGFNIVMGLLLVASLAPILMSS